MKHAIAAALAIFACASAQAQSFSLERLTVRLADGSIVDSQDGQMTVSGTLTLSNNGTATRSQQLCISGVCETFSDVLTIEASTETLSHVLVSDGNGQKAVLSVLNRSPLMLMDYGSNGVIVERWTSAKEAGIEKPDTATGMPPLPTETILGVFNTFRRAE